jgi:mevalonate kinase
MENRRYPGKLLLFGEYTVLTGGRALAIPISQWYGKWDCQEGVDSRLGPLVKYLEQSHVADVLSIDDFKKDLSKGLYFNSSIPQGFGLGSSAALTASIFNEYRKDRDNLAMTEIVLELAAMESYYHGQSSGLDPLVAFLNTPVLHEGGEYKTVELNRRTEAPQIFLINSGIGRYTAPLVAHFKTMLEDADYVREVITPLSASVDHAIAYYLTGSWELFWEHLQIISEVQYTRFKEMLPEPVEVIWQKIMARGDIYLKLCGAGGGGYFLGFARPGVDVEAELGCVVDMIVL